MAGLLTSAKYSALSIFVFAYTNIISINQGERYNAFQAHTPLKCKLGAPQIEGDLQTEFEDGPGPEQIEFDTVTLKF